jgi:hypothetical protein
LLIPLIKTIDKTNNRLSIILAATRR